ncbi:MAG: N-acetyltransferase family protein [Terriglobia bacterium]
MERIREVLFRPAKFQASSGIVLDVREYQAEDFGLLVEMYKDFEPKRIAQGLPPPDVPRIAHWLDGLQTKSRALIALVGQRVVGHVILCPISDAAVEFTIFVHQDLRAQNVGTEMTRLALAFSSEMGFAEAFLTTELTNIPALRLYRKLGFRMTSSFGEECEMKIDIVSAANAPPRAA